MVLPERLVGVFLGVLGIREGQDVSWSLPTCREWPASERAFVHKQPEVYASGL